MAIVVDQLRAGAKQTLLLDGGGTLDRPEKAPYFAEVFSMLRYDACGLSSKALSPAGKLWRDALVQHNIAVTSSTASENDLSRFLSFSTQCGAVGIISIPESKASSLDRFVEITVTTVRDELIDYVRAVAILSRLGVIADVKIAHRLVDLQMPVIIFGSSQSAELGETIKVGPVMLAPVGNRGMYLSCVDLDDDGQGRLRIVSARRVAIRPEIPERQDVAQVVYRYFEDAKHRLQDDVSSPPRQQPPAPSSCGRCHVEAMKKWRESRHAHAVKNLKEKDRLVPDCLSCHSEIFRSTGVLPLESAVLSEDGVTCATCHLQGGEHAKWPSSKPTTPATAESDCTSCHTPLQQIYNFNYNQALGAIRHWKARRY